MSVGHKPMIRMFLVFVVLVVGAAMFFRPKRSEAIPVTQTGNKTVLAIVPKVIIREDTLTSLVHSFLSKRNIDKPGAIKAGDKNFKIVVGYAGDPIEFINNPELMNARDQGFEIRKNRDGSIEASFRRFSDSDIYYVELPTDILYRLLDNLN